MVSDDTPTTALAEIRARYDKASKGPWETTERHGRGFDDEGWSELTVKSPSGVIAMTYWTDALETENPEADGAFIAAAREDVPRLVAALDAVLKLADGWESKAGESRAFAARKLERGNAIPAWISEASADAREDCVQTLREAIARELAGEGDDG